MQVRQDYSRVTTENSGEEDIRASLTGEKLSAVRPEHGKLSQVGGKSASD